MEETCRKRTGLGIFPEMTLFSPLIHRNGVREKLRKFSFRSHFNAKRRGKQKSTETSFSQSYAQGTRKGFAHAILCYSYPFPIPLISNPINQTRPHPFTSQFIFLCYCCSTFSGNAVSAFPASPEIREIPSKKYLK